VTPVLQALVLAEKVYEDRSGKKIIAGTFNRVVLRADKPREQVLPDGTKQTLLKGGMHAGSPSAYISLTDVARETRLSLQFVNLTKNVVLFGTELHVTCEDRLATVEIIVPLPPLNVPEEGSYAFEVVCEGEILGSHRIIVSHEGSDKE